MDEDDFMLDVLTELEAVLHPVVNTGASRDQLAEAAKKALQIVEEAYDELDQDEDDDEEEEEEEDEPHFGHKEEEEEEEVEGS